VGPGLDDLAALIADLQPDRQAMWRERKQDAERGNTTLSVEEHAER
jgi:hypothetical protein